MLRRWNFKNCFFQVEMEFTHQYLYNYFTIMYNLFFIYIFFVLGIIFFVSRVPFLLKYNCLAIKKPNVSRHFITNFLNGKFRFMLKNSRFAEFIFPRRFKTFWIFWQKSAIFVHGYFQLKQISYLFFQLKMNIVAAW